MAPFSLSVFTELPPATATAMPMGHLACAFSSGTAGIQAGIPGPKGRGGACVGLGYGPDCAGRTGARVLAPVRCLMRHAGGSYASFFSYRTHFSCGAFAMFRHYKPMCENIPGPGAPAASASAS